MGKNKQQASTEDRASKKSAVGKEPGQINGDTGKVNEQPKAEAKPAATATPAPAVAQTLGASKQDMAIAKLKEGWAAKGVNLDKLTIKDDGKFKVLVVAEGWPRVTIGPTGGIVVTDLKSYAKAFDAAMDGLSLYQKQQSREAKKTQATAPAQPAAEKQTVSA
jgi:hypothetical protein